MALLSLYSDYTAFCRSVVIETNVTQNFFFDSFVGNCEIDLEIKRYFCRAGVQSIQIHGTMRVILEPLIGDMPLVGALSIFFLRKPVSHIYCPVFFPLPPRKVSVARSRQWRRRAELTLSPLTCEACAFSSLWPLTEAFTPLGRQLSHSS